MLLKGGESVRPRSKPGSASIILYARDAWLARVIAYSKLMVSYFIYRAKMRGSDSPCIKNRKVCLCVRVISYGNTKPVITYRWVENDKQPLQRPLNLELVLEKLTLNYLQEMYCLKYEALLGQSNSGPTKHDNLPLLVQYSLNSASGPHSDEEA